LAPPPEFRATLTDQAATPEAPNQAQNGVFLALVRAKLSQKPSAAEISKAVLAVLASDLQALLPWWASFQTAAQVPNSPEQRQLRQITGNAIACAVSVIGASA
jgi:hypothetical protein